MKDRSLRLNVSLTAAFEFIARRARWVVLLVSAVMIFAGAGWTRDERAIASTDPVADFLRDLPLTLRSNPSLVYKSRSVQESSWQSPRVILADATSNIVYAFNGDPAHRGFDRIEAMEFDPVAAKFKFFEITFKAGAAVRSADNPAECMSCHRGPDPRPNWESYDHWVGVYGSNDDRLTDEEVRPFKEFLTSGLSRPRYNTLNLESKKPVLGYSSHFGRLPDEPNIAMTHKLADANFKRVARLITESADYAQYKYLIAGFLNEPGLKRNHLLEFLPENERGYDGRDAIFDYYSTSDIEDAKLISNLNDGAIGDEYSTPAILLFRSLFESRGIDVTGWFMNFKAGLSNNFVNGTPWEPQLLQALMDRDPELKKFIFTSSDLQMDQMRLVEASLDVLQSHKQTPLTTLSTDKQVPERIWRGSCANCHTQRGADVAPQMTWNDARQRPSFKRLIQSGRMPKDQVLTAGQKRRLLGL